MRSAETANGNVKQPFVQQHRYAQAVAKGYCQTFRRCPPAPTRPRRMAYPCSRAFSSSVRCQAATSRTDSVTQCGCQPCTA
jgi:hypothetical protein